MHALAAKFGALALSPFFFFGGHASAADQSHPEKYQNQNHSPSWQQVRSWVGGEKNKALAIKSIDGPTSLDVNASGEWTMNVMSKGDTDLSYSVVWGDEAQANARSMARVSQTQSSATFSHAYESAGTYSPAFTVTDSNGRTATKSVTVTVDEEGGVHLDSLSVTSGAVGTTVTAHGSSFTSSSTVTVGDVEAKNVTYDVASGTISFVVPQLTAGEYYVRVNQGDERSNPLSFTVIPNAPRLSISGVDAPVRLVVGAEGTWTVHAAAAADNLRYSVIWGDEASASARLMASADETQTSATFTHVYEAAGTYKPKFTITDDSGRTATVSASVVVR